MIVALPGHTENLPAGTTNIPSGISLVGIGYGNNRPQFKWAANANTQVNSNGAGIQIQNCIFDLTQIASVTLGFLIAHSGFSFISNRIIQASATNQATQAIKLAAGADDFTFVNNDLDAAAAAGASIGIGQLTANAINRLYLYNNSIHGDFSTAPINLLTTTNKEMEIENNVIKQLNAATKPCLIFATGNNLTGLVVYNTMFSVAAAAHTDFITNGGGTGMGYAQNFGTGATGGMNAKSAILIPDGGAIP
jgi:hypothetical protein